VYTVVYELYRNPEMTRDEFVDYWLTVHRPIAVKMPRVKSYEIWPVTDSGAVEGSEVDGFVLLRFDSEGDFEFMHDSPEYAETAADARKFTRHFTRYAVDTHQIIPAA
jgi:uncharacterized protein (TIGR02118 family)